MHKPHPYTAICKKKGVQIKRIPRHIRLLKSDIAPGCVCAGSYALSQYIGGTPMWTPGDIDIFLTRTQWEAIPLPECGGASQEYSGMPARVKKGDVNYIFLSPFGGTSFGPKLSGPSPRSTYTPQGIIRSFDITICQVAMYLGNYFITNQAVKDIKNGVFHTLESNIHNEKLSASRIKKYEDRGFKYLGHLKSLDDILFKEEGVISELKPQRHKSYGVSLFAGGRINVGRYSKTGR